MNDWIIANINNPDFTISDFQNIAEMNSENTQLLRYDEYLKKDFIINNDLFKDNTGNFNEDIFKNYYINKGLEFQEFHENEYLDEPEYNIWDVRRTRDSKVINPNLQFITVHNPDRVALGVAGLNTISERTKTVSELAQNEKIWDPEKGKFLDYSPNDKALFKEGGFLKNLYNYTTSLFDEPLVIAAYEEDGYHLENGRQVRHRKGQYKLNENGTYYAEKLNGRSVVGKQFISALDLITVDDSKINKYDFFDADGMTKDAVGNTVKNLVAVAPLYFLGPTGAAVYGGIFVARELAKALPMLADIFTLFGEDQDNKFLHTAAAYGHKFTGSTSEYAKTHLFSYENIANLAADVALQWGQQKAIANTTRKLLGANDDVMASAYAKAAQKYSDEASVMLNRGLSGEVALNEVQAYIGTSIGRLKDIPKIIQTGVWKETPLGQAAIKKFVPAAEDYIKSRIKLGQDLSLAYMAIVSNTDVYESVLRKGGTQKEAAAMALGSIIGMYSVDKFLGLGTLFFDDVDTQRIFRQAAVKSADEIVDAAKLTASTAGKETVEETTNWIKRGIQSGKNVINEYKEGIKNHTLGIVGKAIGEGLEEVSEELVQDLSKTLGEIAGEFGLASQTNYGAFENPLERYAMSFVGGAIGGGMFGMINNPSERQSEQELIYLIRNGKTNELLKEVDKLHKKGKLASTTLSINTSEGGNFISADKNNESQNDYVYKRLKEAIIQMDNIINENKLNLNENQLFDKLVLSEARYLKLRDYLQDKSYVTGYQQEYQNLITEFKDIDAKIDELNANTNDSDRKLPNYIQKLKDLEAERNQIIEKRNKFLSGEYSAHYLEKMLWAIDTNLSGPFISMTYAQFVRHNFGKDINYLTESEEKQFSELYKKYEENSKKRSTSEVFRIWKEMGVQLNPILEKINEQDVISWGKIATQLEKESPLNKLVKWTDKLDDESDEEFENKDKKLEGEDDQQFNLRQNLRKEAIDQHNNEILQNLYQTFIQGQGLLDQSTYRKLLASLSHRKKDIIDGYISKIFNLQQIAGDINLTGNAKLNKELSEILQELNETNADEIYERLTQKVNEFIVEELNKTYQKQRIISERAFEFKQAVVGNDGEIISPEISESLTKQHIFDYFDSIIGNQNLTPEQIRQTILAKYDDFDGEGRDFAFTQFDESDVNAWIDEYIQYKQVLAEGVAAIQYQLGAGIITEEQANEQLAQLQVDASEQIELTDDEFNKMVNDYQKTIGKEYLNSIKEEIIKPVKQDQWIKIFNDFKQKLNIDANPVIQLLKITNPLLGTTQDLETQLEEINKQWEEIGNPVDFELSEPQIKALKDAAEQLSYVRSHLIAASAIPTFTNPTGHNRALNEFAKNNSNKVLDWKPLPEISQDVSNVFLSEMDRYINEADFWIQKAYSNAVNKKEEFKQTDKALLKSRLDFYKQNKLELSDGTNLLEGWVDTDETLNNLVSVNEIIYNNFRKALAKGWKEEDILSELLEQITIIDNISQQITTPIDRNIQYSKYSDYDKFVQLVSTLAIKDSSFYTKLKNHINSNPKTKDGNLIAPLSVQEYSERVAEAVLQNPDFINKALEIVNQKSTIKLPIIKNSVLITGSGGAGKTDVVVREVVSNIDPKQIWISGPTEAQIEGLQEVIKEAKGLSVDELMTSILGENEYNDLKKELEKDKPSIKYFKSRSVNTIDEGRVFDLDKDKVKFKKLKENPEVIVIDEATHVSGLALQLLGEWANQNKVKVILVGDENQKGFEGTGLNVDREKVLMWRAPRLGISLRDSTYQKVKNLQQVLDISEDLRTSLNLSPEKLNEVYNQKIPSIEFKYYLDNDKFSGEIITKDITPQMLKHLKGVVGYVGQDDETYKFLKDKGINVQLLSPDKIQGREFDYVVINKEWTAPELDETGLNAYRFLQDLYTMMSRSKEGTIFMDNGLSSIIKNKQESIYARVTSVRESAEDFRMYKLQELETLTLSEETKSETEESEETVETEEPKELVHKDNEEAKEDEEVRVQGLRNQFANDNNYPIRVYGNVHLLGVSRTDVTIDGKPEHVWENKDNSYQDIGIFLRPGEIVSDGKRKNELVQDLLDLKSVFLFGVEENHHLLSEDKRRRFTKKSFKDASYHIQVKDNDYLIGGTNLDVSKLKLNDKVISIVAKIKDTSGNICTISLGTLADPATWEANKANIVAAINEQLKANPSEELQKYVNELDGIILQYKNRLSEISKENQEIRINKPNFTNMTELIFTDSEGNKLSNVRLEDIDSKRKPWYLANPYAVVSDVHILTEEIPDAKLKPGSTVRYVSANRLLRIDSLEDTYWRQRENNEGIPQVRLQVMHNEGISFRSLYQQRYKDLYIHKIKGNTLTFPINLEYQSMQMYRSMWNFRANLTRFNKFLNDWKSKEKISEEELDKLIKLDAEEYTKLKKKHGKLSEDKYRELSEHKDILSKLWKFNDDLAGSVRQFRLGYSQQNGAYLRTLTNIDSENSFYDVKDPIGIYITPKLAEYYETTLNSLFNNFLNKIVEPPHENIETHIDKYKKGWFKEAKLDSKLSLKLYDINETSAEYADINISLPGTEKLKAIPVLLTEMAKYITFYSNDKAHFIQLYRGDTREDNEGMFRIKLGDEEIDYLNIFDPDESVIFETTDGVVENQPGIHEFTTKEGAKQTMDFRLNNLWDLMFHGSIENASKNDFTDMSFVATDAYFKNGLSHEPIMFDASENNHRLGLVASSQKFYSTDSNVGFPLFYVNLAEYSEEKVEEKKTEQPQKNVGTVAISENNKQVLKSLGIDESSLNIDNIEDLYDLVNSKKQNIINKVFTNKSDTVSENLIVEITLDDDNISVKTLKDIIEKKVNWYEQYWENGILMLKTEDNSIITVQFVGNELEIGEKKQSLISEEFNMTGNDIVNFVKEFRQKYPTIFKVWDDLSDEAGLDGEADFNEQVDRIFQRLVKETIPNGKDQLQILTVALNEIQESINGLIDDINSFDEDIQMKFKDEIDIFNKDMNNFKTNNCKL